LLDAVDAGPDADNTLICFFADHGDHLGDHRAWQKESFFEQACHIPFLVSWPERLPKGAKRDDLVCLTDLFGIATSAAGKTDSREGIDVIGVLDGKAKPRERLFGYYGVPGTDAFKIMVREGDWKYIFLANGGREQLFNEADDPNELRNRMADSSPVANRLRAAAAEAASRPNVNRALDGKSLRVFPFQEAPRRRIHQFDHSRGVSGFPQNPGDVLRK
jgi:choline-sulfatase